MVGRQVYLGNAGHIHFALDGGTYDIHTTTAYNDGQWHYVVAKWDGTTMRLKVDGVQIGGKTASIQNFNGYWRIGYNSLSGWPGNHNSDYFNGRIDEIAIYSYNLLNTQITNHYSASGR